MAKRRGSKNAPLTGVGDVLLGALSAAGLSDQAKRLRIFQMWREAVGDDIAARTAPESFKRGVLLVRVSSPTWQNELTFLKAGMLQKLNSLLGQPLVRDIKVVSGHLPRPVPPESPPDPAPVSDCDRRQAATCATAIDDDDVRLSFVRLMSQHLAAQRRGRK